MRARVLIVEEEEGQRERWKAMLRLVGCEVTGEAGDGLEAIRLFLELRPELVLLSVYLPRINGDRVLTELLEIDPQARVIMFASSPESYLIYKSIKLGAEYVDENISTEELGRVVEKLLARRPPSPRSH